jgi:hypothetical protein
MSRLGNAVEIGVAVIVVVLPFKVSMQVIGT